MNKEDLSKRLFPAPIRSLFMNGNKDPRLTASTAPAEAAEKRIAAPGALAGGARRRMGEEYDGDDCFVVELFFPASIHSCALITVGGAGSSGSAGVEEVGASLETAAGVNQGIVN